MFFFIEAFAIAIFIIYLGEHYLIDAIFGFAVATIAYLFVYHKNMIFNFSHIKKIAYFSLVASVFLTNVFLLIIDKENIGFGNNIIAIVGLILGYIGIIIWLLGFWFLRHSFSLFNKADSLVTSGIYRYFKHPIYFGMGFAFLGLSIAKGSISSFIFTLFVLIPLNFLRSKREERLLFKKYGKRYYN